eukprot:14453969-Alexandrium_andersonii.AAC.1
MKAWVEAQDGLGNPPMQVQYVLAHRNKQELRHMLHATCCICDTRLPESAYATTRMINAVQKRLSLGGP